MILQALVRCYEVLAEQGKLQKPGWSPVKVNWGLELNMDGQVCNLMPLERTDERGKTIPQIMSLPTPVQHSSNAEASFLCNKAKYMLGIGEEIDVKEENKYFTVCKQKHQDILKNVQHPMASAIVRFFNQWDIKNAKQNPVIEPYVKRLCKGGNIVFLMEDENGDLQFAQDVPEICTAWDEFYGKTGDSVVGRCLVTGEVGPIAILHQSIKGVSDTHASGAKLVSFNMEASESYGKDKERDCGQGRNAPVGKRAEFAYTAALNYMTQKEEFHTQLGDTLLVYWTEEMKSEYNDVFSMTLSGGDGITQRELDGTLKRICQGKTGIWKNMLLNPTDQFYILGLTPDSSKGSRLSIRFFYQNTFKVFAEMEQKHQERLKIDKPSYDERERLSVWMILKEIKRNKKKEDEDKSEEKLTKLQQRLANELVDSILFNKPYPTALFMQTEICLHAERKMTYGKAAIIKAFLLRNVVEQQRMSAHIYKEVLGVKLNEKTTYIPYRLGRLFAILERLQKAANPDNQTTIGDRYFNSACATPGLIFPKLIKSAHIYMEKLEGGLKIYYNNMIMEIIGGIDESYPMSMNLQDQGIFQVGYYHQQQKLFTKKEEKNNG